VTTPHTDETAEAPRPPPDETVAGPRPPSAVAPRAAAVGERGWTGGRFDGYEVVGELGRGAVGVVLRARDPLGREVALKTLQAAGQDATALARFRREAEALAALDHPNVVKVHAAGDVAGRPYLVCELIAGARPLDQLAPSTSLEARVLLVRDAARGLGHAHGRGIVHRDVKASNLLVDETGRVRVTDFGLAMFEDGQRLTQTGFMVGTPLFMAPEQLAADRSSIGPASDVWGLGVVLYQALTGRLPFDGETLPALIKVIRAGQPVPPRELAPQVSPFVEAVCLRALALRPADRWASGAAMADALDAALRGEASGSALRGRWRPWWLGALVAGGAVVVGAAWSVVPTTRAPVSPTTPPDGAPAPPQPSPELAVTPVDDLTDRRARLAAAADEGDVDAMVEHGDLLAAGRGGPVDVPGAIARFRRAADLGHPVGAARLARRYRLGDGLAKDLDEAVRWGRKAVEIAEAQGPRSLARTLRVELAETHFERGQLEDLPAGANLLSRGRDEGDPPSMLRHAEYLATLGLIKAAREEIEDLTRRHPSYEPERADALRQRLGLPPLRR
jgi:hypothetical protein